MNQVRVDCYSGFRADERPLRFTLRDKLFNVVAVDDQWYSPEAMYFRVQASDGNFYVLRHDGHAGAWSLDAFRRGSAQ